ncbi:MAG TPA: TRAP transporter substrate-binding protein [Burkholderiales bacterium]|nr:TRAP transporter substrate-binding protein [Burkholderiales bacterium]
MRRIFTAVLLAGMVVPASGVQAQPIDTREFSVVGTWNFLSNWQKLEQPFWKADLPKASGGAIRANLKSVTEVNLKGTEVLRLLKQGVFDFAAALPIYVEDGGAVIEAVDLAGVARTYKMSRDISNAWMPQMRKVMRERHNAVILASFTFPEQDFYCKGEIKTIADLKGRKVRVQGTSQADLVRAFGAAAVTIAFGEVVPALEKGVVDCGITGTMPAYKAKWPEVTDTLFRLPVGFTVGLWVANASMWSKLSPDTRAFLEREFKALEDKSWKTIEAETEEGVACTTGQGGACNAGPPAKLKLVIPSAADLRARDKAVADAVLASWAKRCGDACAGTWNELVGRHYGLTAKAN